MSSFINENPEKIQMILTWILSFILVAFLTYKLIPILHKKQMGQNIREEGPQSHRKKAGTPSMGGVAIIIGVVVASIVGAIGFDNIGLYESSLKNVLVCLVGFVSFGAIGFFDDYLKVIKKQNEGLKAYQKFGLQFIFSTAIALYITFCTDIGTSIYIPFFKVSIEFGIWFVPFVIFTMLAMTNGVNLTDGLDGLATGVTSIVGLAMGMIAMLANQIEGYQFAGSEIYFLALSGGCIGFLLFNKNPAKIFMGDTGSLAIGGGLTAAAIMMRCECFLPVVGIIYVCETLSVVLQVGYFKLTKGKRLFRMAPIHHHFEEGGMKETKVVKMFWIITFVFVMLAICFGGYNI